MKMVEVTNSGLVRKFLELPLLIYKDDPEWIRPLDKDIEQVFNARLNKTFRHGRAIRWILTDERGHVTGRIAAFVNEKSSRAEKQPTGGIGFFECINDRESAFFLFDHAIEWLKSQGMEAVDGPINFGERDRWWGLLVDGFYEPVYCMNYNPPYYQRFFEEYGFRTYYEQYCYSLQVNDPIDPKFEQGYNRLMATGQYHCESIRKSNIEKYARDFTTVYNKAWARHGGGKQLEVKQAIGLFKKMKPVMEESLVWFAYYQGEPVGAWINLPELNQYFKYLNGRFGIFQKLKFLYLKTTRRNRKFYGIVFGVVPEHQGKGVDGLMIWSGALVIRAARQYQFMELQWIGDFNPKMISIAQSLGTKKCRTLITYRKLFDPDKPFERYVLKA
jgi:hypothetical protein